MFRLLKSRATPNRKAALAGIALFSDLTRRELKIVAGMIHERAFLAGEVVFDEGEDGQAIYLVLDGQVTICAQGRPDQPIVTLDPGAFFGELALIDGGPRSAQARAATDCTVGVMFRGDFHNLMQSHALIAAKVSFRLAQHYARILRRQTAERREAS